MNKWLRLLGTIRGEQNIDDEPIGELPGPKEIRLPVDDADEIKLKYEGQWFEVVKTSDGLEIEEVDFE